VFERGDWSEAEPAWRKKILLKLADLMAADKEQLALLESLDMGKSISNALADVDSSINCIRWNAEAIDKIYDEIAPTGPDVLGLISRQPLGVVAAIVPWNFPLSMASWKLGPALATGNSVILKPSEKSPLTAIRLAALAQQAGLPDGVLNVLPGFGGDCGQALGLHMDIDGLVFTGSTAVGKKLFEMSGQSNMKRIFVECGGKSPNIVFADCPDLDAAAKAAAAAIFYNQGEVCVAGSRLLVERSIKEEFLAKVMAIGEQMAPGHPLDPNTFMGAIVDEQQLNKVCAYVEKGQQEGATLRMGGQRTMLETGGFYLQPTVFDHVDENMAIAQEEIFGPVLSALVFDDEEQALAIANNSDYGLAAAVWTSNLTRAHRMARKIRAGTVWVNAYFGGDMSMPFGGFKQSGNGRDKSLHAFDKYLEIKSTWINLNN
jgi:acyl-CoA reductase-like NAD-dependent aldehyde dehydrogenase